LIDKYELNRTTFGIETYGISFRFCEFRIT